MDFIERLQNLSKKVSLVSDNLQTEEATKNALVMPFLHSVLGYDVFDPHEVIPEFTADTGVKKGEKVDYALIKDDVVQILIECKKFGEPLSSKHTSQLYRYFSVTHARIAMLTNGCEYEFYTDLDEPNKMDAKPFLYLNLNDIDEHIVPEIKKLTKNSFDVDSVVDAAGELKYLSQVKKVLEEQFKEPEEAFVKFFASKVYEGVLTPKVKAQFLDITTKALKQFLSDSLNERLKSAIVHNKPQPTTKEDLEAEESELREDSDIVTTQDELDGFYIVRAILCQKMAMDRICYRDTKSYFGVLLDNNNRKPLCRLHFNTKQKYIGLFDMDRKETKYPLENIEAIYEHTDKILAAVTIYE
jgi:hypothetical protein